MKNWLKKYFLKRDSESQKLNKELDRLSFKVGRLNDKLEKKEVYIRMLEALCDTYRPDFIAQRRKDAKFIDDAMTEAELLFFGGE